MILFPTDCNILDFQFLHPDMIFFSPLFPRILRARQSKQHIAQWVQTDFEQASPFSNFSGMFLNPNNFFNMNSHCSNFLDMKNLQEQVKKAFCY